MDVVHFNSMIVCHKKMFMRGDSRITASISKNIVLTIHI